MRKIVLFPILVALIVNLPVVPMAEATDFPNDFANESDMTFDDSTHIVASYQASVSETGLTVVDSVSASKGHPVSVSETGMTVIDSVATVASYQASVSETPIKYALLVVPIVVIPLVIILITRRKHVKAKFELPSSKESKIAEERINPLVQKTPPVMKEKPIVQAGKKEPMIMRGIESEYLSQLEAAKRDLQECLVEIDLTSNRIQVIKNEHNLASSLLENTKKEIELTMSELSALKSERQSLASEMQSLRSEHANLHPELQHEELQFVKEKVDAMKNEISSITAEMSEITHEYVDLKHQIALAKSELDVLQSTKDEKEKEISRAKNELAFIELELANVNNDENKKIIKAASSMVGAINSKYEETRRELEGLKATLAKIRNEYEAAKSEERRD